MRLTECGAVYNTEFCLPETVVVLAGTLLEMLRRAGRDLYSAMPVKDLAEIIRRLTRADDIAAITQSAF